MLKPFANISRILVGLTFIFSGVVKAIDPLGYAYKIHDYFIAYNIEFLSPLALFGAIFFCMLEFSIGVCLLFNVRTKLMSWISLFLMAFFTVLTLISALYNPVSDCGCFGDAIKLTNWETFAKNVVLMLLVVLVFLYRKRFRNIWTTRGSNFILISSAFLLIGFSLYNYYFLPIIDFLPWKVGNKISELVLSKPEVAEITLVYKNKFSGKEQEYTPDEFAKSKVWEDSLWLADWQFKEQRKRILKPAEAPLIHDFRIDDEHGDDHTAEFINDTTTVFIVVAHNLKNTSRSAFSKFEEYATLAKKDKIKIIVLTSSDEKTRKEFCNETHTTIDFYTTDETALKTMIRSNPGILLIKNGTVLAKWSYLGLPSYDKAIKALIKN